MTAIAVHRLHKRYRGHIAVQDVSFTVAQGEIFGILGPNGAGKTTIVECIAGLRTPDGGQIRVLGLDPQRDRAALRQRVGVQLQASRLPGKITVGEALALFGSFYQHPADQEQLLADLGLAAHRARRFEQLSGGQQQRLSIALALVGNPEVVILDELTTGLDPQARRATWAVIRTLRARGTTVLLVTHAMEEAAQLCDRLALIDAGRIVAVDTPAGFMAAVGPEQRVSFRPSAPLDLSRLAALPEVRRIESHGDQICVSGVGNLLGVVTAFLAREQIVAADLRLEHATLEDAVGALTRGASAA
jgi:ABC-2 type transport system ATP-binding protein